MWGIHNCFRNKLLLNNRPKHNLFFFFNLLCSRSLSAFASHRLELIRTLSVNEHIINLFTAIFGLVECKHEIIIISNGGNSYIQAQRSQYQAIESEMCLLLDVGVNQINAILRIMNRKVAHTATFFKYIFQNSSNACGQSSEYCERIIISPNHLYSMADSEMGGNG